MSKTSDPATFAQQALSVALLALAGTLFGGALSGVSTVLTLSDDTGDRVGIWLSAAILLMVLISVFFGGRGIAYGPNRTGVGNRFNLQAAFGVVAVMLTIGLVAIIYIFPASQAEAELAGQVSAVKNMIDETNETMGDLEVDVGIVLSQAEDIENSISSTQIAIEELFERIERLEAEVQFE